MSNVAMASHWCDIRTSDAGIKWMERIPAHWEVVRLRYLADEPLAYGANEEALEDDPSFPRFVRITDINEDGSLRPDTFKSLPPHIAQPFLLREGDILLARSGATVGKAFIYRSEWGEACFAGYLIRFRLIGFAVIWIFCSQTFYTLLHSLICTGHKYAKVQFKLPSRISARRSMGMS